jgi:GAF domain-containing protein
LNYSKSKVARQPVEVLNRTNQADSVMTLAFQAGQNSWATLQVMDDTEQRIWNQDEQLLVKQVTDQLSLALENAHLFQETTQRQQVQERSEAELRALFSAYGGCNYYL